MDLRVKDKIGFYLLSMTFFIIFVLILGTDIPIYFGTDCEFIGWKDFFSSLGIWIPIICGFLLILIAYFIGNLFSHLHGTKLTNVHVESIDNKNTDVMSFVASYFFPLISFSTNTGWQHVIVLAILFVLIGIIYIKSDIYYLNPTLLVFGFRIYEIKGKYEGKEFNKTVIAFGKINKGNTFSFINIDENVCFAVKD